MSEAALHLVLELSRAEEAGDPYAFRFTRQEYRLRTPGGGVECVELPWGQALLDDLGALRAGRPDPALVQRVGEALRAFLKPAGWPRHEQAILDAVQHGRPVFLTFRSSAAELYALPWELITLGPSGQHLGELPGVLLRYAWPETTTTPEEPSPRPEGGRILVAWSAAGGAVPVSEHIDAIQSASDVANHGFDPERDVLPHVSYGRLKDALDAAAAPGAEAIAAIHLLCHGAMVGSTFGLSMNGEDEGGEPVVVDAAQLRRLIAPHAGRVRLVLLAACDSANSGAAGNALGSVAQAIHRAGIESVIASRFPLSVAGSNRFTQAFYQCLLARPSGVEQALCAARDELSRDPSRLDWASLQLHARPEGGDDSRPLVVRPYSRPVVFRPYRGLLAFQPEHSRFFFGRDAEITQLLFDLNALLEARKTRFLVVAGSSGTGKSSMVLAGAVPRMLNAPESRWLFASMRPGGDPLAALTQALEGRGDPARPLLLVVDQLEEIFTHTESAEVRQAFVRRLWALAGDPDSGISVLLTIRVDFIGRCGEIILDDAGQRFDRVAYDEAHRVFVAQMGPGQIEKAIAEPARLVGLEPEAGLIQRMLDDVGAEPGALPLLQDTLDLLWQRRDGRFLTQAAYDAVGGVAGALQGRADALLDSLDEASRKVARKLLVRLIGLREDATQDTRRRLRIEQVRPGGAVEAPRFDEVLALLVSQRLLVLGEEGTQATVEVAHEALIRSWNRLRQWVNEDRDKLLQFDKLEQWVIERNAHGTLLSAGQLAYAEEVAARHGEDLGAEARRLLEESRAEAQKKRWARRLAVACVVAAAIGFAALGWWGLRQAKAAQEHAAIAEQQAEGARANALSARDAVRVSTAQRLRSNPEAAMLVLRDVEAPDPGQIDGWLGAMPHFAASPLFLRRSTLSGHEGAVVRAAFSPDGARVVTASRDTTARIWSTADGSLVATLEGHREPIYAVAWSPDGARIVTGAGDGSARVWKADGRHFVTLEGHRDRAPIHAAAWSPDGAHIVTGSHDGAARIWKADGTPVATLEGHTGPIRAAGWSADGTRIATASDDATARIWDVRSRRRRSVKLEGHTQGVLSAAWSPDGAQVVTASEDGNALVWTAQGKRIAALKGHQGAIFMAAWSPDGARIVTASGDKTARIWKADGTLLDQLAGHADALTMAAWSRDGRYVITASYDDSARVWSVDGALVAELKGQSGDINAAAWSPDGASIITASDDKTARIWKASSALVIELKGHAGPVHAAAFSPDGAHVVTGSDDRTARIFTAAGEARAVLEGHEEPVIAVAWSADGSRIATASMDGTARVFTAEGKPSAVLKGHDAYVVSVAWSADGSQLITAAMDGTARIFTADGKPVTVLRGGDAWVMSAAFGADGPRFMTLGTEDRAPRLRKADGSQIATLGGHARAVTAATWSLDGTRLVTVSADKSARIFTAAGHPLAVLEGHVGPVLAAAFSADNTRIVTTSEDRTARLWTAEGTLLATLEGHAGPVHGAAFSADGARIVTASEDGTARLWLIEPRAIRRALWASLPSRGATADEDR